MNSNDKVMIRVGSTPRSTKETKKREALEKATARRRQFIIGMTAAMVLLFVVLCFVDQYQQYLHNMEFHNNATDENDYHMHSED
ncbi:Oidioi.mRNA.OKI2018_I69.PAR.g9030.t1.cds [Oikopleura dioica]|uniref:Oidioi.mRNA.OKI2018_I69.PAR.g9030.t1.cds n=1 Tax=Oikopleura dioica TaxID=34765 RepID=A0ABN7RIP3_OIKDI|nr:Oidioi.mRNA.OKI2018_I69.PAR.g9030.t1.cds [Oikopleura dioica]